MNYDEWISNKESNEETFKKEIADILKVDVSKIEIQETKKGSVLIAFVIVGAVLAVAAISYGVYRAFRYQGPAVPVDYDMKPDDQIKVKYKNQWYPATVIKVEYDHTKPGKTFKVRYNPVDGKNIFWSNTESFNEEMNATRLKLPNRAFTVLNGNIVQHQTVWTPPPLCNVSNTNTKVGLKCRDHVFIKAKNNVWYSDITLKFSFSYMPTYRPKYCFMKFHCS